MLEKEGLHEFKYKIVKARAFRAESLFKNGPTGVHLLLGIPIWVTYSKKSWKKEACVY